MEATSSNNLIDMMFEAGVHYGYAKSRRHPSVAPYIFGTKNKIEIFDLEKTKDQLEKAKEFAKILASKKGVILFASSKKESVEAIQAAAVATSMPYVAGRWIGGVLTNFSEIRKRIDKLVSMKEQKEKGEFNKYTKRERLLIDREMTHLEELFSGLIILKGLPQAIFVVDPREEETAVREALRLNVPVIALAGSDCDVSQISYPIVGNDSNRRSISFIVDEIAKAYKEGLLTA